MTNIHDNVQECHVIAARSTFVIVSFLPSVNSNITAVDSRVRPLNIRFLHFGVIVGSLKRVTQHYRAHPSTC